MKYTPQSKIPAAVGVGYKPQHLQNIIADSGSVKWLEIHAENYMSDGGPATKQLRHLRERFPISCHGVGLSIGGELPLNKDHLARLKNLVDWLEPGLFSEHLAWSTHDGGFLNDLLPLPYNTASVTRVADHIDELQNAIGRQMLLENPSTYVAFKTTTMDEIDFLNEIVKRTGCGLLLDVNNVFVSGTNQDYSPEDYIDRFPVENIGELHLGGHAEDLDDYGATLLIDSHNNPVVDPVWTLYDRLLTRSGPLPTLVEWDNDIPDWPILETEAARAMSALSRAA